MNILPEGTGLSWTETQTEQYALLKMAHDIIQARFLAGPMPVQPAYLVERGYPSTTVDAVTHFIVQTNPDHGFLADPTAAQLSADFQAELAAWNARFAIIFAELRK